MWMTCSTQDGIAEEVGLTKETTSKRTKECQDLDKCLKSDKLSALFGRIGAGIRGANTPPRRGSPAYGRL